MALYQNTSNYGPGVEISLMLLGLGFHKEIKREIFKNLIVPNSKIFMYVASSSGLLLSLFIWYPLSQNWSRPRGHKSEHRSKESRIQNSSSLNLEGAELWYLVCSISLWTSTKFVHMMVLRSRLVPLQGQSWNIGAKKSKFKILHENFI